MYSNIIRGRVWKFGDNISTDLIMPGFAVLSQPDLSPEDAAKYSMVSNRPGWAEQVEPGDIIIAGKNFGCGSSRPGSKILKTLGIELIIAESISRIFFRNSINVGLAAMVCPGIWDAFEEGEIIEVNLSIGEVKSVTDDRVIKGEPLEEGSPPAEILKAGGIVPYVEKCES